MAAVGTVLSVAQTLLEALQTPLLKEICSVLGYKTELDSLKNTVSTVKAVLLDAETKQDQDLSHEAHDWIEKLKYVLYDADDMLDEFTTLAEQKKLLEGGKISNEVCAFFSHLNQLGVAYTMSRGIKKIRKKLDNAARDHAQFGIGLVNSEPIRRRNKETCSYVYEQNIIGREEDKRSVVDMLLDPLVEGKVSFVTIVGIGGLGKTALAQLVYNDQIIENQFPLRLWACVSDQDPKYLDMKAILCKILESATGSKHEGSELDRVQSLVRKELDGKKYLLVLDDVWNEDRGQCLELSEFLMGGASGSRVVVTTRSKQTAKVIGDGCAYELQGLSEDNSWSLFKRIAFKQGRSGAENSDLVEIGKRIVRKCANVPLAIRMVGALLYGQSRRKWLEIERNGFAKRRQDEDDIVHVLKLSYHHLDTRLKSCFTFCAIFPKDHVMDKVKLISLWMAQGYIDPLDKGQTLCDAGDDYFSILLQRCFFQDVKTDAYGQILSCKMHDLMHDIAQQVAGNEICVANSVTSKIDERVRHLFAVKQESTECTLPQIKVRTYLRGCERNSPPVGAVIRNWKYLRALEMENLRVRELPHTLGKLLHLRHLDLSNSTDLERLPEQITKLHNLQSLMLRRCSKLKELPSSLGKLVELRFLDISECDALSSMPRGIDKLTNLCILPLYIVGKVISACRKQHVGQLDDIEAFPNLKDRLMIKIHKNDAYVREPGRGELLKNKEHLSDIDLRWLNEENDGGKVVGEKETAEDLQPHCNLKGLFISGYHDVHMPSWAVKDNLKAVLPNLVRFSLEDCKGLQVLPVLNTLRFLKSLQLSNLPNLTHVEEARAKNYEEAAPTEIETRRAELSLYPSLEELSLLDLPKLKGWQGGNEQSDDISNDTNVQYKIWPLFPQLSVVRMRGCPRLKKLTVEEFNERMELKKMKMQCERDKNRVSAPESRPNKLRSLVETDDTHYLSMLPKESFQCLQEMIISGDDNLMNLSEIEEVFRSCWSSLKTLEIRNCARLRTLSGALDHVTALQSLTLLIPSNANHSDIPWRTLNRSLRSLEINFLPEGIQHLTSLQYLVIGHCSDVDILPEWISFLSSLQVLQIDCCSQLKSVSEGIRNLTSLRQFEIKKCSPHLCQRFQKPDGQDWAKIQHIPHIVIDGMDIGAPSIFKLAFIFSSFYSFTIATPIISCSSKCILERG